MRHARLMCGTRQLRVLACESGFERLRGLLGHAEPEPGVALLLQPCWAVHTVGMRYSIDVVFCDARWRVLRVVPALRPGRAAWLRGAARVLEVGANTARPLGLVAGTRLQPDDRLQPPQPSRTRRADAAPALISAPVRALAGLAAVTVLAALLLGGCAAAPTSPRAETPPGELRLQADIEYGSRAWPRAEMAYRELLRHEPRDADHWQRLGVVFLRTDRAREAVESLQASARLRSPDARTLQNLALAHLRAAADSLEEAAATRETPAHATRSVQAAASADAPRSSTDTAPDGASLRSAARAIEALLPPELRRKPVEPPR